MHEHTHETQQNNQNDYEDSHLNGDKISLFNLAVISTSFLPFLEREHSLSFSMQPIS